jgi:Kef-type K+ transport system membrane component KefB
MKQLLFLFFFIISFGLQVAHAAIIGVPELIILLIVGVIAIAAVVGFVFLFLYLVKKRKHVQNEK